MKKILFALLGFATFLAVISIAHPATAADDFDWRTVETIGLVTEEDNDQHITDDIWQNYTQQEALDLLAILPNRLSSPAYRELAIRLLTSEASQFDGNVDSPAFLAKRMEKLIHYGALTEASDLYDKVKNVENLPNTYELSLIGTMLTLSNGALAPVCLDIQASASTYRDMKGWKELSDFCRIRFGSADKIKFDQMTFDIFPDLKDILVANEIDITVPRTTMGQLIAFNDKRVSLSSYNNAARNLKGLADLIILLALHKDYTDQPTYQCYAIEAGQRGLIDAERLKSIYTQQSFPQELLKNTSGEVDLHPCDIPAYFYQRLSQEVPQNTALIESLLGMKNLPVRALLPFDTEIQTYLQENPSNIHAQVILGAINVEWKTQESSPYSPFKTMQDGEEIRKNDYKEWLADKDHVGFMSDQRIDIAAPLYFSQSLASKKGNFRSNTSNKEYGNFFSLTYGKKSLGLGLGFSDFIASNYDNNDDAKVIVYLLNAIGPHDAKVVSSKDIAVILSGLKAYKLEKEAIALAFEHLQ